MARMIRDRLGRVKVAGLGAVIALVASAGCKSGTQGMGGPDGKQDTSDSCSPLSFRPAQPCGGSVQGSGAVPTGTFSATEIEAHLGSQGSPQRLTLFINDATVDATIVLQMPLLQDGGSEIFFGDHEATARFYSLPTCTMISTTGRIGITSGDDPDTAFGMASGTVAGTFSLSADGFSVTGSFQTPYCRFVSPG